MATSPATIVLGLVTASAFGLAAKDTISHKRFLTQDQKLEAKLNEARAADAQREAEWEADRAATEAAEQATIAARTQKLVAYLPGLFGAAIGPGPAFDGVTLGVDDSMTEEVRAAKVAAFETRTREAGLETSSEGDKYQWKRWIMLGTNVSALDACTAITDLLAGWGTHESIHDHDIYFNPTTYQRVTYSSDESPSCAVTFDAALTARDWVEHAIPAALLGKAPDAVRKAIAARPEIAGFDDSDDNTWSWSEQGVEYGSGRTDVTARFDRNKLVALHASVDTTPLTLEHVEDVLTAKFGKPTMDPYEGETWKRPVLRRITTDGDQLQYDLGE